MEIVGFLALAALVVKIVSVIKAIGKDNDLVITQVVVWAVGIGILLLAGEAEVTETMLMPGFDVPIGAMDFASVVLAGLVLGSSGSFGYDVTIGRNRSEPSLLPFGSPGSA